MKIYNGFGIKPTRNYTAAGIDFFIPNVKDDDERADIMREALKESYKITDDDLNTVANMVSGVSEVLDNNTLNVTHLYYALKSKKLKEIRFEQDEMCALVYFLINYLVVDDNGNVGLRMQFGDMLKINSGIKVALNPNTCMEFVNKSGKGTQGWSVKACLVDEDYTGYVHLSMQYLGIEDEDGFAYVGTKFTQGVVYTTLTDDAEELTIEEYLETTKNCKRGSNGFGSGDGMICS